MSSKTKTALVTGSTSGIGLAIARQLAADGFNIVINGFGPPDEIEAERQAIERDHQVQAYYDGADVTDPVAIAAMIQNAELRFGSLDVLVNNAGIQHVSRSRSSPSSSGTESSRSTCLPPFMPCAPPARMKRGAGAASVPASAFKVASPFKSAYVAASTGGRLTKTVARRSLAAASPPLHQSGLCLGPTVRSNPATMTAKE